MPRKKKAQVQPAAVDHVHRLDQIEALKFGKLDAEMRNLAQGLKLISYEIQDVRRQADDRIATLELNKKKIAADLERARPEYQALLKEIAERHGIDDPKNLLIDPDSGIVHDSRSLTKQT